MVGSAPAALDTLNELAAALGNDPNFATTMLNALSGKQPLDNTLTNLSGKDVAGLLAYLGLGEGSALPVGVPVPWPSATPPTGWLKCNGAAFSAVEYPKLAKAYPTNKLPDLRGEFIRGWDDGRGVDSGRSLLSAQNSLSFDHRHFLPTAYGSGGDGLMSAVSKMTIVQCHTIQQEQMNIMRIHHQGQSSKHIQREILMVQINSVTNHVHEIFHLIIS